MTQFGPTKPHDGGPCPAHLNDDDLVLVRYKGCSWYEFNTYNVHWPNVTQYAEAIKPRVRSIGLWCRIDQNGALSVSDYLGYIPNLRLTMTGDDVDTGEFTVERIKP
jgi:hypothetical protein